MNALAYVLVEPGKPLQREMRTLRDPGPGEALVKVIGCGLCHTDLGYYAGEVPTKHPLPLVLGHEVVGTVAAVGEGASARVGQLVLVPAVMPCGSCEFCKAGRGNACPNQQMPGNDIDGGFASHLLVRSATLVPVEDLPKGFEAWKLAPVADAVSTAFQAVRRSGLAAGDVAAVVGVGGVGGFTAQIAHALGARVFAMDVRKDRLELAAKYGADLTHAADAPAKTIRAELRAFAKNHGVPSLRLRIFECTGTPQGQALAFGLLDRGATMVQVGYTPKPVEVRLSNLMAFDASVIGTWGCPVEEYPAVLRLIASGRVVLDPFVERAPMSLVDEHLAAMAAHKLERRLVLDPES